MGREKRDRRRGGEKNRRHIHIQKETDRQTENERERDTKSTTNMQNPSGTRTYISIVIVAAILSITANRYLNKIENIINAQKEHH